MKHDVIVDYLCRHEYLTSDQSRHVHGMKYQIDGNKYLLQLIWSEPREYLAGLKQALIAAGDEQKRLVDLLPP